MAITLGSSGGIGGGGIVVPVYVLVMGLPLKIAIPCGAITVLGGALGSTILNWHRRHPLADRPVIDWDLVLVMEPLTLIGTLCGTLLHRLLSEKFLVVLLVLLLTVTAHTTLTKAMRMYQAEKRYIRHLKAAQAEPPSGSPTSNPLATTWTDEKPLDPRAPFHETESRGQSSKVRSGKEDKQQILIVNPDYVTLRSDLIEQEKFTPRAKIIALICLFSVLLFLNVMVGGGAFKSPWDIRCGSVAFWTVHVCMVAFLIASAWVAQTYVVARHEIKELVRFDYVHGDIIWNAKSAVLYPLIFITAGFFAGTLGIGGGGTAIESTGRSGISGHSYILFRSDNRATHVALWTAPGSCLGELVCDDSVHKCHVDYELSYFWLAVAGLWRAWVAHWLLCRPVGTNDHEKSAPSDECERSEL